MLYKYLKVINGNVIEVNDAGNPFFVSCGKELFLYTQFENSLFFWNLILGIWNFEVRDVAQPG